LTSDENEPQANPTDNQVRRSIKDEMKISYINYAMSVIIGRALPDVRDGLKPVHRRILFGMYEGGHTSERKYSKSARSVGEVMGKYHPHGDQSIYDTMVRMAQDFSLRYPLIDGQGNFGSIDGDPPAAMRYTESRLDRISKHMLEDIDKKTVDFQPNFDDSENEPTVLPARLPNLLLNGSDGIAVGMATKIPPHNLNEVASAVKLHVERMIEEGVDSIDTNKAPAIEVAEYMEHIAGPDFPTGASIHGIEGIIDMYTTGHGKFHVRSKCEVFDDDKGKRIIITEIPYQVKKGMMLEGIADLVSKEIVKGIRDIRDESSKEGIRVVIEVKQNADPHAVLNQLFKSSRLQESYSANMMGIIDSQPVLLTLSKMLHIYVCHRESVIERRTNFEMSKAKKRAHILEGLVKAQDRIDDVIKAGRGSASREQFERILRGEESFKGIDDFDFSAEQAKAIAERRLYQLSRIDVRKVQDEYDTLQIIISDLKTILGSREKRLNILLEELAMMVERHGDERRSIIDAMPLSMDREDLVEERAVVITLSEDNYIRHIPVEAFRIQNRGGKGLKGVTTKAEDTPQKIITCFSKDRLLIFTDQGRVYGLKAWETPLASRHARGTHIRNLLEGLREDESIVTILPISKDLVEAKEKHDGEECICEICSQIESKENKIHEKCECKLCSPWIGHYLVFSTSQGRIKRTELKAYSKIFSNGKYALKFANEDDKLVAVKSGTEDDHVVLVSKFGKACRFKPAETKTRVDAESGEEHVTTTVKLQGRVSQGVKGINLAKGDSVAGMIVTSNVETSILTITRYGMAKRSVLGTGNMVDQVDDEGLPLLDDEGQPKQDRDGYRKTNRGAGGVKTMNINTDNGDFIVCVKEVPDLKDQLFMLTAKGMMIRLVSGQTKETSGKSTKGTRIMELRNKDRSGFVDEIISAARLPADLADPSQETAEVASSEVASSEEE